MSTSTTSTARRRPTVLNALDVEILRFVVRFQYVRGCQIASWTGASPWTIRKRLRGLADNKLVTSSVLSVYLRDKAGKIYPSQVHVWRTTPRGSQYAGEWRVPGTDRRIELPGGGGRSRLTTDHVIGVSDLAAWYRTYGFAVAAEREVLSLERPQTLPAGSRGARPVSANWSVRVPGRVGIHPPDLGAVHPDGTLWAVELERATKTVAEYQAVISAYRAAGRAQVWHILSASTARRVMDACTRLGIIWGESPMQGVQVSKDPEGSTGPKGMVRLVVWLPGMVVGPGGPADWPKVPRVAPAGFLDLTPIDLQATWKQGRDRAVNVHEEGWESLGGVML